MANPEEAYQIAHWIADVLGGMVRVTEEEARDMGVAPVFQRDDEAYLEFTGNTATWEIVVREAK